MVTETEQLNEDSLLRRIHRLLDGFNDVELLTSFRLLQGLQRGRGSYGPLLMSKIRRDNTQEAIEELRDAAVYLCFELINLQIKARG